MQVFTHTQYALLPVEIFAALWGDHIVATLEEREPRFARLCLWHLSPCVLGSMNPGMFEMSDTTLALPTMIDE
ncbi:hypothetical protein C665_02442 [Thauera aminoaromatica S2]|uniref:Uncharacterized protein n=1 Tax=Thauera aminoaromatica S2 TaxID=1234381 RepID=N6Z8B4_THASP|nr:hypothetical protein C665_02442 [Thauera aminoaromatica S2]